MTWAVGWSIPFFASAGLSVWFSRRVWQSYFAPVGLFSALWLVSLGLLYLNLVEYYPLDWPTVVLFLTTVLTFCLGGLAVRAVARGADRESRTGLATLSPEDLAALRWAVVVLFLIGLAGTLWYYRLVSQVVGLDALWLSPQLVRYQEVYGDLRHAGTPAFMRSFLTPVVVLSFMYLQLRGARHKSLFLGIGLFSGLMLLPSSGRSIIANALVWGALAIIHMQENGLSGRRLQRRFLVWGLVAALGFLLLFLATTVVLGKDVSNSSVSLPSQLPDYLLWVATPYHYVVSPFVAFQEMTRDLSQFGGNGSLTFGAIARILNQLDPQSFAYPDYVQPSVATPLLTNMYTYLDAFLIDFGWAGVVIMPFVVGLLTTAAFTWLQRSPTVAKVYLVSLLGLCIIASTGVNRFGTFQTWTWIAFPLLLFLLLKGLFSRRTLPSRAWERSGPANEGEPAASESPAK